MRLTVPAYPEDGIWFPRARAGNGQAAAIWSEAAGRNAIQAAAATAGDNPFAKYPDWIRPLFAARKGTVLDVGCGYGRISIPLLASNPGLTCVGVDASRVMLEKFVALARTHGVHDRVDLFCGNLDALPFPDGHFDHVVSCAVLLHLPKAEVRRAVAEFRRVLAKGGTLVLAGSFPSALNPEAVLNIPNGLRRTKNGPVRAYLRAEVEALFDGFSGVQVEAHQMIVLPRSIGPVRMPFARLSRNVNEYCSRRFIDTFRHSSWFVNHHDVVATR